MQFQWIPCKIENTGFDSERRFEVDLPGDGKVVGTAYIEYLRDCNHEPIEEGEPPYGKETRGYVMCRVVKQIENLVHVELPGTNVFHVPREALEAIR